MEAGDVLSDDVNVSGPVLFEESLFFGVVLAGGLQFPELALQLLEFEINAWKQRMKSESAIIGGIRL